MFTLFPALPPELRSIIWDLAVPPCVVAVVLHPNSHVKIRRLSDPESTNVQLACAEARATWLAHHRALEIPFTHRDTEGRYADIVLGGVAPGHEGPPEVAVRADLSRDLFYFGRGASAATPLALFEVLFHCRCFAGYLPGSTNNNCTPSCPPNHLQIQDVRHVAIGMDYGMTMLRFCRYLYEYPGLRTVLVMSPTPCYDQAAWRLYGLDEVWANSTLLKKMARLANSAEDNGDDFTGFFAYMLRHQLEHYLLPEETKFFTESP